MTGRSLKRPTFRGACRPAGKIDLFVVEAAEAWAGQLNKIISHPTPTAHASESLNVGFGVRASDETRDQ